MADITQRLGFDVSQGVQALNQLTGAVNNLNAALGRLNGVNLGGLNSQVQNLGNSLGQTPAILERAGTSTSRLRGANVELERQLRANIRTTLDAANQTKDLGDKTRNTAQTVRGSAGAFAALGVATGTLRAIVGVLGEATEASREFGRAIGEVQTIAGDGDSFDSIADSVRNLSREFGVDQVEQARATYQALSNQVIQSANDTQFLADANRLAVAGITDSASSVNLLSSVINSYGLAAADAGRISDVFFKAVEEGRFRIDEIANSLGTVTPLAQEVGVSYEEIAAGLATITRRGTSASVAQTQFRNVLLKLLRPTKQLQTAISQLGFQDAQSALEGSGGLIGLLQRLQEQADLTGTDLVNLFGRARAGQGALNLLGDSGKEFIEIFDEVTNSAGATAEAFETVNQTDARQAEIAFNNLKVTVTELGDAIVPVVTKFINGLTTVVPNAETLGIVLAGAAASAVALGVAAASAIGILSGIGGVLLAAAPALAVIALAAAGLALAYNHIQTELEGIKDAQRETTKVAEEQSAKRVEAAQKEVEEIRKAREDAVKEFNRVQGQQVGAARRASQQISKEFNRAIDSFVKSREAAAKEIENLAKNAGKVQDDANARVKDGQEKLEDVDFNKSIKGFDAIGRGARELQRGLDTAKKARQELAAAGLDQEKIRAALQTRQRAEEQLAAAARTGEQSKNATLQRQIADAQSKFLKDNIRDDKRLAKEGGKVREDQAKRGADALRDQTAELEGQLRRLVELGDPFTKAGFPKTLEQSKLDMEELAQLSDTIAKNLQTDVTGGLAAEAGVEGDLDNIASEAAEFQGEFKVRREQVVNDLQEVISSKEYTAIVNLDAQLELAENIVNEETLLNNADKLAKEVVERQIQAQEALSRGGGVTGLEDPFEDTSNDRGINQAATASEQVRDNIIDAAAGFAQFDSSQIDFAANRLSALQTQVEGLQNSGDISDVAAQQATAAIEALQQGLEARSRELDAREAAAKAAAGESEQNLNNAADAAGNLQTQASGAADKTGEIRTASAPVAGQISAAVGPMNAFASAAERAARATQQIQAPGGGGGAANAFFGKIIRRQNGGLTRGQDRVLTSTAPGEFVVNSAATRRFRSELTAMNGGQSPQFRETGGAVTNVGDINVNIQTQDAGDISGRSIARQLKRELRARTSSI